MSDSVLYCRTLATRLAESGQALRAATRRWRDAADGGRAAWDDQAGRRIFQHYLDPYAALLDQAEPSLLAATEHHHAAMDHVEEGDRAATSALDAARQAVAHARNATNGVMTARSECDAARHQAALATAEAREALSAISQLENG
jgi:hypothetical protein